MNILHLISSPRNGTSASIKLGNTIVAQLQQKHPGAVVKTRNLASTPLPHLDETLLGAFFTPAEQRSPEQVALLGPSDEAVTELMAADLVVIGVPMYNFGIHSGLKAWIDHIVRAGLTFTYNSEGQEGLVKGKKVFLAVASGGVYSDGPLLSADFTGPYLKQILGFIGITDITTFRAEGLALPEQGAQALQRALDEVAV